MELLSSAFTDGSVIPTKYGFKNENINPPLKITNIPDNAKSLVLIVDDPDALSAVGKIWTHWLVWNISPKISIIPENSIPENSIQGLTDFGEIGYGGPAPPDKEHTYFFKLYAINKILDIPEGADKNLIENQIQNNIIDKCILRGKFSPV